MPPETERRVADLSDRDALADLLARHGRWLDSADFGDAATAAVFAPDATVTVASGAVTGTTAIAALASRSHTAPTHHLTTNPRITVSGDRATLTAQQLAVFPTPSPTLVGERYTMRATRTSAGWRLSHVAAEVLWRMPSPTGPQSAE